MVSSKKRSLNEIRQTKDSFYVVPSTDAKCLTEKVLGDYFNEDGTCSAITKKNYSELMDYLRINRYKITKE
jgi:hypothetical protein